MRLDEILEKLCSLRGVSGDEDEVAEFICSYLEGKCVYYRDNLGNVIAHVAGKPAAQKLLVSAHMDEVGLIVTYINSDGTLNFSTVGGIDSRILFGKRFYIGKNRVVGVAAGQAVHKLSKEEAKKAPDADELVIDIGCQSREEAQKLVSIGDTAVFDSQFLRFGNGLIKARAIDDRVGCAIMLRLIDENPGYDMWFSFVVQEEVGLRGAAAAAFSVAPDAALVLEATTASDIPSCAAHKRVCEVGKGPVVSFMDRRTIYDKGLYKLAFETADEMGLPCQTKTLIAGGNDAGAISQSGGGVKTAAVSLPCRYLHSPSCVISSSDLENSYALVRALCGRIAGG